MCSQRKVKVRTCAASKNPFFEPKHYKIPHDRFSGYEKEFDSNRLLFHLTIFVPLPVSHELHCGTYCHGREEVGWPDSLSRVCMG